MYDRSSVSAVLALRHANGVSRYRQVWLEDIGLPAATRGWSRDRADHRLQLGVFMSCKGEVPSDSTHVHVSVVTNTGLPRSDHYIVQLPFSFHTDRD